MNNIVKLWYVDPPCRTYDGSIWTGKLEQIDCYQIDDSDAYDYRLAGLGLNIGKLNRELFKDKELALKVVKSGFDELVKNMIDEYWELYNEYNKMKTL